MLLGKGRRSTMSASLIEHTPSAYDYPLLIKHLLHTPLAIAPEQEIVYRDVSRFPYWRVRQRIGQLASGLTALGVRPGDTVAVMDWDSHRYLECFFAVPMMGAVLQTVNIRLSPEQILYTLNHARADVILCHTDFLPVLDSLKERLETVKTFVVLSDGGGVVERPPSTIEVAAEYEELLARSAEDFDFPDFDEHTRATTFYTTGTTGNPKGVYLATGNWCCTPWPHSGRWPVPLRSNASTVATSTCPLLLCSTSTPGGFLMWQRPWASSRSTRAATCRMSCWP